MGVPGFFSWIIENCNKNDIVVPTSYLDMNNAILYIDFNCLLHPQCFLVLNYYNKMMIKIKEDKLTNSMFERSTNYIDYLIKITKAKTVYIAVDGVAPLAKVSQQRKRRFKTVVENRMITKIKDKYGISDNINAWDNTCITPGTEFMVKLDKYLQDYVKSKNIEVTYSSCFEEGEGEHKILQHIRDNKNSYNDKNIIIYGLDADLIFLALASGINNIYLLREHSEFSKTSSESTRVTDLHVVEQEFKFVNIKELRRSILNIYSEKYGLNIVIELEDRYVNDFIFICYLLGNDFLPHLPGLSIKTNGLNIIMNAYCESLLKSKSFALNNSKEVDTYFLSMLLSIIRSNVNIRSKPKYNYHMPEFKTECDRDIWKLQKLQHPMVNKWINIQVHKYKYDDYKYLYYQSFFGSNRGVQNVCAEYYKGLQWVTKYYFDKVASWSWQYPYTHGPFIDDLIKYEDNTKHKFSLDTPLTPYQQLLAVLPPSKFNLIPELRYRSLMIDAYSPIIDLYPSDFVQDMTEKTQLYECVPIIPIINRERIIEATKI